MEREAFDSGEGYDAGLRLCPRLGDSSSRPASYLSRSTGRRAVGDFDGPSDDVGPGGPTIRSRHGYFGFSDIQYLRFDRRGSPGIG